MGEDSRRRVWTDLSVPAPPAATWPMYVTLAAAVVAVAIAAAYATLNVYSIDRTHVPLIQTAVVLRLELVQADLHLQHALNAGGRERPDRVWAHLEAADQQLEAAAGRRSHFEWVMGGPTFAERQEALASLRKQVAQLREAVERQWRASQSREAGAPADMAPEAPFEAVLAEVERLQSGQRAVVARHRAMFWRVEALLVVVTVVLVGTGTWLARVTWREHQAARGQWSEEASRLMLAMEAANDVLWEIDFRQGRFFFSRGHAKMLGYGEDEANEVLAKRWEQVVHPDDMAGEQEAAKAHFEGKTDVYEAEFRLKTKTGQWRWIRSRGKVVERNESGKPLRWLGTNTDITDQKAAEQSLEENESRLRLAMASTNDGMWDVDLVKDTTYLSPRCYEMLGYTREEYLKLWEDFWGNLVHPEDRVGAREETHRHFRGETSHYEGEFRILNRAGHWQWVLSRGRVVERDETGKALRWIGTHTDIHLQKTAKEALAQSEKRLRLAMESTNDGMWDWNLATGEIYLSPRYQQMLGYTAEEMRALWDRFWDELVHPEDREREHEATLRHFRGETSSYRGEFRIRAKSGQWLWVLARGQVVQRSASGKAVRWIGTHTDISERKATERALRLTQFAVDHTGDLVKCIDSTGSLAYVNQALCRLLGYTPDELRALHIWDINPELSRETWPDRLAERRRAGSQMIETAHRHKDGTIIPVETTVNYVTFEDEAYVFSFTRDIRERKQIEQTLREQAEVARNLYDGVILTNRDGRITDWNDGALRMFGYRREEVIGKAMAMLYEQESAADLTDRIMSSVVQKGQWTGEIQFMRKDGTQGVCETVIAALRDDDGGLRGTVGVNRDITERKRAEQSLRDSEEKFRVAFTQAPVGIALMRPGQGLIDVNEAFCRMLGYTREEMLQTPLSKTVHPADREMGREPFQQVVQGQLSHYSVERRFIRKNRGVRWGVQSVAPQYDAEGNVAMLIVHIVDITQRRRAEAESQERLRQLARTERLSTVGVIAATLAHELNQPLTAIVNYGHGAIRRITAGTAPPDVMIGVLRQMVAQAQRTSAMLGHVRSFIDRQPAQQGGVDIKGTIEAAIGFVSYEVDRHGVEVKTQIAANLPAVDGDEVQIEQVLVNLMLNALDAMARQPDRPRRLVIEAKLAENGRISISVRDTGPGLSAAEQRAAFGPFFSTKSDGTGMGMGLSISRSIVESYGGDLRVESEVGEGSTFHFSLPPQRPRGRAGGVGDG